MRIADEGPESLPEYETVPIRFGASSRVDLQALVESNGKNIVEIPMKAKWKDYDANKAELPSAIAARYETTNWVFLAAYEGDRRLGGAILVTNTPDYELLKDRPDSAVLHDIRVAGDARQSGVGRALFRSAAARCRTKGISALIVETQDTNIAACRFYAAMGCTLESCDPDGYGVGFGEAKLIWRLDLAPK